MKKDLVIIGGGPAGMSAAKEAFDNGIKDILILERDKRLGGILNQCIHNGFGLHKFGEELTGPEYALRYRKMVEERKISYYTDTMVTDITPDKVITAVSAEKGVFKIEAKAIILAMGCRERSKGALNIPGNRPAGLFSAGTAQKLTNLMGYLPGKKVVILGSGDIGLIMARRMTLEGAEVKAVCEIMPYSGGLARNIKQCLDDFNIPLMLSHTITEIHGDKRVTGVTIAKVDERREPVKGTEQYIECDTVLFSCGLIPENELSKSAGINLDRITGGAVVDEKRKTSVDGIFACGNVLHVHDLVDFVSEEGEIAGKSAAEYIKGKNKKELSKIKINTKGKVRYTVPHFTYKGEDVTIYFRVSDVIENAVIEISDENGVIKTVKKKKVAPGEMQTVKLTSEITKNITGESITVSAEVNG